METASWCREDGAPWSYWRTELEEDAGAEPEAHDGGRATPRLEMYLSPVVEQKMQGEDKGRTCV
jgi:hypothetical protein